MLGILPTVVVCCQEQSEVFYYYHILQEEVHGGLHPLPMPIEVAHQLDLSELP